jgi:hypothetical protein
MYADPSLIRDHVVKLRLNDREAELINAWVNYTGQQKATLLREMLLEQARLDIAAMMGASEGSQMSLLSA